jgi:hypothetical protein
MMMHPTETELDDYIDDVLDAAATQRIRSHLAECDACAAQADAMRALAARLAQLPRDVAPETDLRAGMWQKIDEASVTDIATARRSALWSVRYRLATAAVILIVASSAITLMIVRSRSGGFSSGTQPESVRLVGLDSRTLERQYSEELRELELVLRKSRAALAPETVRILEDNLRIIDNAIREAKGALASDPQSDMLIDLLRSAYEQKLELLRQAAKSSPVT